MLNLNDGVTSTMWKRGSEQNGGGGGGKPGSSNGASVAPPPPPPNAWANPPDVLRSAAATAPDGTAAAAAAKQQNGKFGGGIDPATAAGPRHDSGAGGHDFRTTSAVSKIESELARMQMVRFDILARLLSNTFSLLQKLPQQARLMFTSRCLHHAELHL